MSTNPAIRCVAAVGSMLFALVSPSWGLDGVESDDASTAVIAGAPPEGGACCYSLPPNKFNVCEEGLTIDECNARRQPAFFHPNLTCPQTGCNSGACCQPYTGPECWYIPGWECFDVRGDFFEGLQCDEIECPPLGSCCFSATGECVDDLLRAECPFPSASWHETATCAEIECEWAAIPTTSTWGLAILTLLLLAVSKAMPVMRRAA